jgi:hypothetical protein
MDIRLMNAGIPARRSGVYDAVFGDIECRLLNYTTLDGGEVDASTVNASTVTSQDYILGGPAPQISLPRTILSNYGPRYTIELSAAQPSILFANGTGANQGFHLSKPLSSYVPGQMIEYLFEGSAVSTGSNNFLIAPWFDTTEPANAGALPASSRFLVADVGSQSFSFRFLVTIMGVTTTTVSYNVSTSVSVTDTAGTAGTTLVYSGEELNIPYDTVSGTVFTTLAVVVGPLIGAGTITLTVVTTYARLISGSYGFVP